MGQKFKDADKNIQSMSSAGTRAYQQNMSQMQQSLTLSKNLQTLFKGVAGPGGIFNPGFLRGFTNLMMGGGGGRGGGGGGGGGGAGGPGAMNPLSILGFGKGAGSLVVKAIVEAIELAATVAVAGYKVASRASERGKFAFGLGGTVGGVSAAEIGFDRNITNVDATLGNITKGLTDFTSPEYLALKVAGLTKGMTDQTTPEEVLGKAQVEFAKESKGWSRDRLGPMAQARGWSDILDPASQLRLWQKAREPGGIAELEREAQTAKEKQSAYDLNRKQVGQNQDIVQFGRDKATWGETQIEKGTAALAGAAEEGNWGPLKAIADEVMPALEKGGNAAADALNALNKSAQDLGKEFREWLEKTLGIGSADAAELDVTGNGIAGGPGAPAGIRARGFHGGGGGGAAGAAEGITVDPKSLPSGEKYAAFMKAAMSEGATRKEAAALAGQATAESGLGSPRDLGVGTGDSGAASGMFQWHSDRWNPLVSWAKSKGMDPGKWETQVRMGVHEWITKYRKGLGPGVERAETAGQLERASAEFEAYLGWKTNPRGAAVGGSAKALGVDVNAMKAAESAKPADKPADTTTTTSTNKDKAAGKTSMNDMSIYQQDRGSHIRITNPAGANVNVQTAMLGAVKGSFA
jgi:Phage tail lysozyme